MTASTTSKPVQALPAERSFASRMVLRGKRIASRKSVKHLIRAITRYGDRLGSQFAGAMTYFSFLSLVPILMVGFAIGGIVLANNQQLLNELEEQIAQLLPAGIAEPITALIDSVVSNPLGVGIVGLLIALYSGIGWMGNLRKATRAIWRPEFEENKANVDNFVIATLKDLGSLAGTRRRDRRVARAEHLRGAIRHADPRLARASRSTLAGAGGHGDHPADRDGRRRVDLHVGLHDAARARNCGRR